MSDERPLLEVKELRTTFSTRDGDVHAVNTVDLTVNRGEVLGLVGESGCGKSVTSLSILRLLPRGGQVTGGSVHFDGQDLLALSKKELAKLRGDRISMIFQQPQSSLNPVYRVGAQIAEVFELHRSKQVDRQAQAVDMLRRVGIPDAERRAASFPHEFSGGMAQRVMIATALALEPELLIADEPTTALDVTIQAQILDLMEGLRHEFGTAIVLITHDLGVVAELADRVAVMYAGQIVEEAPVSVLFDEPAHPYTRGLIGSIPMLGENRDTLAVIPGTVPSLGDLPDHCRFAERCSTRVEHSMTICEREEPALKEVGPRHRARCFHAEGRIE